MIEDSCIKENSLLFIDFGFFRGKVPACAIWMRDPRYESRLFLALTVDRMNTLRPIEEYRKHSIVVTDFDVRIGLSDFLSSNESLLLHICRSIPTRPRMSSEIQLIDYLEKHGFL